MKNHKVYRCSISFFRVVAILCLLLTGTAACNGETPDPNSATEEAGATENGIYAFVGVNVVPMTGETILENQTVVVREGRITAVGPEGEIEIPEGATEINGEGKYLMPGLTEMHGHIPGPDNMQYTRDVLFLYISNGVTTVRNMAGHSSHIELREQVKNNEIPGPTFYAASPWLNTSLIPSPEDAEGVVRRFKEEGFDHLKIGSLPRETYRAMAEAAHEIGIPFAGHIPEEVGLTGALDARQASIDHYDRYVEFLAAGHPDFGARSAGFFGSGVVDLADEDRITEAIERTIEAGTWNVPTLSLVEHLASPEPPEEMIEWPEMQYMPQEILDGWVESKHNFQERDDFQPEAAQRLVEIRRKLTRELYESGAPIALGSDAPQFFNVPGFSIHHEMEMMAAAGLTPYQVLVTGTRNPALYFGTPDEFGTVEENRRADLILLNANPLGDIANVREQEGVMVRGNWWPAEKIEERLNEISGR